MKKIIYIFSLITAFIITITCAHAQNNDIINLSVVNVLIDGNKIEFEQPPVIVNDRVLVPLRKIYETLGAYVEWNGSTQTITGTKDSTTIKLTIGDYTYYINNTPYSLDSPPIIVNDNTLVPIRVIAECFGCDVDWDSDNRTVLIFSGDDYALETAIEVGSTKITMDDVALFLSAGDVFEDAKQAYVNLMEKTFKYGELGKTMGIALSEEDKNKAKLAAESFADNRGGIEALKKQGSSIEFLIDLFTASVYQSKIQEMFKAEFNGISLGNVEITQYFINNYYRAKHVLVNDKMLAAEIYRRALNGEDFDSLIDQYNEDPGMRSNPDGYVFGKGYMVQEFEDCTKSLAFNEIGFCKSPYGYHIVQRLSLLGSESNFGMWFEMLREDIVSDIEDEYMSSRLQELCNGYNINSSINYVAVEAYKEYMLRV